MEASEGHRVRHRVCLWSGAEGVEGGGEPSRPALWRGAHGADAAAPAPPSLPATRLQMGRIFQLQRNLTRPPGGLPVLRHTALSIAPWPSPVRAL